MSSTVSLQNLLAANNINPKSTSHPTTSSEEFSEAVATATSSEASSQQESSALLSTGEILQGNTALEARLVAEQTGATLGVIPTSSSEQSLLTLESVLAFEADASPSAKQAMDNIYSQASFDIIGLERSFLELIQAVQKEDIPQVRKVLGQVSRRQPRAKYSAPRKDDLASDPLERFVEEMESALAVNDLYAAQLTINSFLAHLGESRGNFVVTRV